MRAVLIRIGQDDDAMIFERTELEILPDTCAQRGDQRAEFLVHQHLIQTLLFGIEGFSAQRQNRLEAAVAALLSGTACGITLDDEQLVFLRTPSRAGG